MPKVDANFYLVRGGGSVLASLGCVSGLFSRAVPLVEMNDSLRVHSYSQITGSAFGWGSSSQMSALPARALRGVGVVSCCSSTESLILAQDERWRRA